MWMYVYNYDPHTGVYASKHCPGGLNCLDAFRDYWRRWKSTGTANLTLKIPLMVIEFSAAKSLLLPDSISAVIELGGVCTGSPYGS